jgi:hypothetical protein
LNALVERLRDVDIEWSLGNNPSRESLMPSWTRAARHHNPAIDGDRLDGFEMHAIAFMSMFGVETIAQGESDPGPREDRKFSAAWPVRLLHQRRLRGLYGIEQGRRRSLRVGQPGVPDLPFLGVDQHAFHFSAAAHHLARDGENRAVAREFPTFHHRIVLRPQHLSIDEERGAFPFRDAGSRFLADAGPGFRPIERIRPLNRGAIRGVRRAAHGDILLHDGQHLFRRHRQRLSLAAARVEKSFSREIPLGIDGGKRRNESGG